MALILTQIRNTVENWYELYACIDDIRIIAQKQSFYFVFCFFTGIHTGSLSKWEVDGA